MLSKASLDDKWWTFELWLEAIWFKEMTPDPWIQNIWLISCIDTRAKKTRCSNKVSSLTRSDHSSSSNVPDSCSRRVLSFLVSILISFVCLNPFLLCFLFSWSSGMQNTGLQSEDLWIIGSFLEEHIIFPAGQHKIILWNRLTIINICLLWTTSKRG